MCFFFKQKTAYEMRISDWSSDVCSSDLVNGPRDKIAEELAEVADAANEAERHEEVGDLLFAVVNYARKLGVDAESALRDANLKFAGRFAEIGRASCRERVCQYV